MEAGGAEWVRKRVCCSGMPIILEQFQEHGNRDIRERAIEILLKCFAE